MIYKIQLKSGTIMYPGKIELDEYWKQSGKKIKFGVAYLICKDLNTLFDGKHHIEIKKCKIGVDDIATIRTRSNDYESNEDWKLAIKGTSKVFSYKKASKVTENIRKLLKK